MVDFVLDMDDWPSKIREKATRKWRSQKISGEPWGGSVFLMIYRSSRLVEHSIRSDQRVKIPVPYGAGCIGFTVIRQIIFSTDNSVMNLDKLTYAGNLGSLAEANLIHYVSY